MLLGHTINDKIDLHLSLQTGLGFYWGALHCEPLLVVWMIHFPWVSENKLILLLRDIRTIQLCCKNGNNTTTMEDTTIFLWRHSNLFSVHDAVIKWKLFPRYWPVVRWIHRSLVNSPRKGPGTQALVIFFVLTNGYKQPSAGDLRRHDGHCHGCHRNERQKM